MSLVAGVIAFLHLVYIGHVHERRMQSPSRQSFPQQERRAVVQVLRRDQVVSGGQGLEHGGQRGGARRERCRVLPSFQVPETLLQKRAGRIAGPSINEVLGIRAVCFPLEGGRHVYRRSDRAGGGVDAPAAVNGKCLDSHGPSILGMNCRPGHCSPSTGWPLMEALSGQEITAMAME